MVALQLTASLGTPYLPVTAQPRLVYLLLEVGDGTGTDVLATNLALVVDTSDSMYVRLATNEQFKALARMGLLKEVLVDGIPVWQATPLPREMLDGLPRKMDRVKEALRGLVEQLRPTDRFTLVAFAGQALTLVPNTPGGDRHRLLDAVAGLDHLQLGDATYLGAGMALGFEELRRGAGAGLADRMLVLTDGFTLDEPVCREWAERARAAHISISTLGLGGEFNEELMIPIADRTGGEAYLIEEPAELPAVFTRELQRGQAVQCRNLELKLRPAQGMEVRAAYRVRPSTAPLELVNNGGSYSFTLGDLVAGEAPAVLLELLAAPRPAGTYRLAQALLACDDPAGEPGGLKVRTDIVAEYTEDAAQAAQLVPEVMYVVEALSAYRLQERAQADLHAGDVTGATRKLRAAATRLLELGEAELAAAMEQQATELEQHGQADSQRAKRLRYETRRLTQRLTDQPGDKS